MRLQQPVRNAIGGTEETFEAVIVEDIPSGHFAVVICEGVESIAAK